MTDTISKAAKMAGEWWAERLSDKHADKRPALAAAIAKRVEQELRGECYWDWWGERKEGVGYKDRCRIEFDYDPHNLLIPACEEIGLDRFEARWAFPTKHDLDVTPEKLEPKEGYGNWTAEIPVGAPSNDCPETRAAA